MAAKRCSESTLGEGTVARVQLPFAAVDDKGARLAPTDAKIISFKGAA